EAFAHRNLRFANGDEKLVIQPGEGLAILSEAAGDLNQLVRWAVEWQETASAPTTAGEYMMNYPRVELAAAANAKYHTFFNPSGSGKTTVVRRLGIYVDADGTATSQPISIRRISAASGGTALISAANIPKKHTSTPNSVMELRYNNVTATLSGGSTDARITSLIGPGAAAQAMRSQKEIVFATRGDLILKEGQGIALYTELAGDLDQYVKFFVEWQEVANVDAPTTVNEYLTSIGMNSGVTNSGYVYSAFYNPPTSGTTTLIKRVHIRVDSAATATSVPFSLMRISTSSAGSLVTASDIPAKNTSSGSSVMEIRKTGVTVTYSGSTERLIGVSAPSVVTAVVGPALSGRAERTYTYNSSSTQESLVLKPGEGIALRQETAGFTGHRVFLEVEWQEVPNASAPAAANEFVFSTPEIVGAPAAVKPNYVYGTLYNPADSGKNYVVQRMEARVHATTSAVYVSASFRRISTSSNSTLITASNIGKKNASSTDSTAQIRHSGTTVLFSGATTSRLSSVITPGANNQANGLEQTTINTDDELVIKPGEGIAFYQEAGADVDQKYFFQVEWREDSISVSVSVSVSGTVYGTNETSALQEALSIKLAVGDSTSYSANTSAADGTFTFSGVTQPSDGTVLTVWLNTTLATSSSLVFKYGSSCNGGSGNDCTGLSLYQNRVSIDNKHTGSMAISDLTACNNSSGSACSDTDIGFVATTTPSASSTLSWLVNILKVMGGATFAPGGNLSAQKLSVAGTYTGDSETITLSEGGTSTTCTDASQTALCVSGTFTPNSNTVKYTGTSAANIPALTYNNLELSPSSAGSPTYTFASATATPASWYNSSWNYRKAITIDKTKVSTASGTALSNFPVLLHVAGDANLKYTGSGGNVASSTGGDILITSSDGTSLLNYEIEKYSSSTGETIAWVKVPTLSTTTDTTLYMYYGNASAPYNATTTGVWDANYKGVWHFGDSSTLNLKNSVTGVDGTNSGVAAIAGKISGAASFMDATDIFTTDINGNYSSITIEAWAYQGGGGGSNLPRIIEKRAVLEDAQEITVYLNSGLASNSNYQVGTRWNGIDVSWYTTPDGEFIDNTIQHIAAAYDGSSTANNGLLYLDSISKPVLEQGTAPAGTRGTNSANYTIGNRAYDLARYWGGWIDEVRISDTIRSADWIATGYANQNSTTTFYAVNGQETPSAGVLSVVINSNLTIGDGTNPVTVSAYTNSASTTILGNFTINANATYVAASTSPLNLAGSFTNNGTFTHSNGTTTFTSTSGTKNISGNTTFYNLDINGSNGTFNLYASAPSTWYSTGGTWNYRKAITIDKTKVSTASGTALSNFPVLLHVAGDADLKYTGSGGNVASSTGGDILITSSDGTTKLNYEIEKYSSSTGETIAWVKVPTLSTTTDTTLYMYYGNASAPYNATTTGVWDSDYRGVWHFSEASSPAVDSKNSISLAQGNGTVFNSDGKINKVVSGDGADDELTAAHTSNLNIASTLTLSTWLKLDDYGETGPIIQKRGQTTYCDTNYNYGFFIAQTTGYPIFEYGASCTGLTDDSSAFGTGSWTYLSVVVDEVGDTIKFYRNGAVTKTLPYTGTMPGSGTGSTDVLGYSNTDLTTYNLDGSMDELRLSAAIRSVDWIVTEYNSQNSTTTFYSVGTQENYSSGIVVANNLAVSAGTVTSTSTITVSGGSVSGNGTINITGGTFNLSGAGNFGGNTGWTFNNLTLSGTASTTSAGTGGITVAGTLTNSGILSAGSKTWILSGSGTPFVQSGTFYPQTSTFIYSGTSNATVTSATYYNLSLAPAGTPTYT
ncbi:MAG: DUF2341 domain-containing protein, partial [Elusimicrobiota bacterium]